MDADESQTSLEDLVDLLQGGDDRQSADAGIAGQGHFRLDRIAFAAGRESDECVSRIRCLLELLEAGLALESRSLAPGTLVMTIRHLTRSLSDLERWQGLAGNAAYYRDHPVVAARVAQKWRAAGNG